MHRRCIGDAFNSIQSYACAGDAWPTEIPLDLRLPVCARPAQGMNPVSPGSETARTCQRSDGDVDVTCKWAD